MDLQQYFDRVRFDGEQRPSLAALSELQKCHVCSVPFENLDVQLGRRTTTDVDAAFEKIVRNGRGGWCYEQNGLFGWVLSQLGFDVTRLAASVMREDRGEATTSSHLSLLVAIPDDPARRFLVDVGFGGSLIAPIEFMEAEHSQPPFRLGLQQLDDGYWRFWENDGSGEFNFDFLPQEADETALAAKCGDLQTDPESGFVLNLAAQLRTPDRHLSLRGKILKSLSITGESTKTLESSSEFVTSLRETFGLVDPEIESLWPRVVSRHEDLFPEGPNLRSND